MRRADKHDAQVHAEVEDLEDLGLGERQHHDAAELGQGDPGEDLEGKMGKKEEEEISLGRRFEKKVWSGGFCLSLPYPSKIWIFWTIDVEGGEEYYHTYASAGPVRHPVLYRGHQILTKKRT